MLTRTVTTLYHIRCGLGPAMRSASLQRPASSSRRGRRSSRSRSSPSMGSAERAHGDFTSAKDGRVFSRNVLEDRMLALITLFEGRPGSSIGAISSPRRAWRLHKAQSLWDEVCVWSCTSRPPTTLRTHQPARPRRCEDRVRDRCLTGLGALPTTLIPSARLVTPAVPIPTGMHLVAPTETTTTQANTTSVTRSSSRGEHVRKAIVRTLAPRTPSAERSRGEDAKDKN